MDSLHEDAKRMAQRFLSVRAITPMLDLTEEEQIAVVFGELLRAEAIFAGPSLYANPSV